MAFPTHRMAGLKKPGGHARNGKYGRPCRPGAVSISALTECLPAGRTMTA